MNDDRRGDGLPDGKVLNGSRVRVAYIAKTEVKIGRVRVVTLAQGEWVGNWCWNTVTVSGGSARRIMNYLKLHRWACEWRQGGPWSCSGKTTGAGLSI